MHLTKGDIIEFKKHYGKRGLSGKGTVIEVNENTVKVDVGKGLMIEIDKSLISIQLTYTL